MAEEFKVRRDSSTNNVPTVGYNEGADAQDVILFGACKVTETLTVDGTGKITLSDFPVSLTGEVFSDNSGVRRGRNLNDDITITVSGGSTTYFAGSVSPTDKTLKVYSNRDRTSVISGGNVSVTYYKRVPVKVNGNGELIVEEKDTGAKDVNIVNGSVPVRASANLPVVIKSSDVALTEKEKIGIMLKKEGTIAAGASANDLAWAIGDSTKEAYITNVVAYYNGTDVATDPRVICWFDILDSAGTSIGTMDLTIPGRANGMLQLDFGPVGLKVPVGGKFRIRVPSSWTQNIVHVLATGWQYVN